MSAMTRAAALALLAASAWMGGGGEPAVAAPDRAAVPFVGCGLDGQLGFEPAPVAPPRPPPVLDAYSDQLAYYASEGMGVLAPRGWHCAEVYGSSGAVLVVTPEVIPQNDLSKILDIKAGPIVRLDVWLADTSGRSAVARITARMFPSKQALVEEIEAFESDFGLQAVSKYPVGPYAGDLINRRSDVDIEPGEAMSHFGKAIASHPGESRYPGQRGDLGHQSVSRHLGRGLGRNRVRRGKRSHPVERGGVGDGEVRD